MIAVFLALAGAALAAPADTADYVVLNHGRPAGEMRVVSGADSAVVRFAYVDRQRGPRVESRYRMDASGAIVLVETRGLSAAAQPAAVGERFSVEGGMARWRSMQDSGAARAWPGIFYRLRSTTPYDDAMLARHLLRRPGRSARLLPAGEARAEIVADTTVGAGGERHRVRLVAVHGVSSVPEVVWLDARDALFATDAGWFVTVRRGAEDALPALRAIEGAYYARRAEALARRLPAPASGAVVIRNGDVFDSETGLVRPRTTVVIEGDRIVAVGPADAVRAPARATVIDATGKTVIPGLWDMHTHLQFGGEASGVMQLAAGITTIRDVASDVDAAVSQRDRAARGSILSPRLILAGFIEGPGRWAGPSEALARTEDEARAWVARYDSLGYRQIKLYNLVHPDLVPAIAEETHRRGMRLSGHVPRGLTIPVAIALGLDEINHAAFLFSTFFQDSLYAPRMRAYSQVASAVAPAFDVGAPQVTALIALLRERKTVVDGTFNVWQDRSHALPDGKDPVFGPTLAWLPPLVRRSLAPPAPASGDDGARAVAASDNYRRLLKRLFDGGVTLVAGTDNVPGLSYHGELEIYERAGIPAASVLQIATIVSARVMGEEMDYGSIAPGKVADLAIVDGRPAERITDLRRTERVVRAGRVYATRDLYALLGITPER